MAEPMMLEAMKSTAHSMQIQSSGDHGEGSCSNPGGNRTWTNRPRGKMIQEMMEKAQEAMA